MQAGVTVAGPRCWLLRGAGATCLRDTGERAAPGRAYVGPGVVGPPWFLRGLFWGNREWPSGFPYACEILELNCMMMIDAEG